ncbi:hypothetical protein TNCV_3627511 [Trichonephila clavipes]|nr:hypothetical protein TNCV_3627511 [Trichonephila clavipes]
MHRLFLLSSYEVWCTRRPFLSVEDFIGRISVVAGRIRDVPGIFQNVRNSIQCPCQAFQTTFDRNFVHLS